MTDILCEHIIFALFHAKIDLVTQISRYYHKDSCIAGYRQKFQPVGAINCWPLDNYPPLEPPPIWKLPDRPYVKRNHTDESSRRRKKEKEKDRTEGGPKKLS